MDENKYKINTHPPYCTCVTCSDYRLNKKHSNKFDLVLFLKKTFYKIKF